MRDGTRTRPKLKTKPYPNGGVNWKIGKIGIHLSSNTEASTQSSIIEVTVHFSWYDLYANDGLSNKN